MNHLLMKLGERVAIKQKHDSLMLCMLISKLLCYDKSVFSYLTRCIELKNLWTNIKTLYIALCSTLDQKVVLGEIVTTQCFKLAC